MADIQATWAQMVAGATPGDPQTPFQLLWHDNGDGTYSPVVYTGGPMNNIQLNGGGTITSGRWYIPSLLGYAGSATDLSDPAQGNQNLATGIGFDMVLDRAVIQVDTAPGTGKSVVFRYYADGVAVGSDITLSDADTSAVVDISAISLTQGQLLSVKVTTSGAPSTAQFSLTTTAKKSG